MHYDSRRWTGRYRPGEMPSEFRTTHPYRRRALRWVLLAIVIGSIGIAVAQPLFPSDGGAGLPFGALIALVVVNVAAGQSPFARAGMKADRYDEFERVALERATSHAYSALSVLAAAAFGWCAFASARDLPMPHHWGDWATWAITFLAVASNLPAMLAEFMVPMPGDDEAQ